MTISEEEYSDKIKKLDYDEAINFRNQFLVRYNITEQEFDRALNRIKEKKRKVLRKRYEDYKEKLNGYPEFDELYDEIVKECYEFNKEENQKLYLDKYFNKERIEELNKCGLTDEDIVEMKKDFFHCSFIADYTGEIKKYGREHGGFFHYFYQEIGMNIDRECDKSKYCFNDGDDPIKQVPDELKDYLLYYEVSFSDSVTESSSLFINYYFAFTDKTKEYLLKFETDFDFKELQDLTLYKNDKVIFFFCTHECFNSLEP